MCKICTIVLQQVTFSWRHGHTKTLGSFWELTEVNQLKSSSCVLGRRPQRLFIETSVMHVCTKLSMLVFGRMLMSCFQCCSQALIKIFFTSPHTVLVYWDTKIVKGEVRNTFVALLKTHVLHVVIFCTRRCSHKSRLCGSIFFQTSVDVWWLNLVCSLHTSTLFHTLCPS